MDEIGKVAEWFEIIHPSTLNSPDVKDQIYLDLAATAQADFIITGNTKDFPLLQYGNTKVVSPREFLELEQK